MSTLRLVLVLAMAAGGLADTITLKNGRVIQGTYLGGTAREVRVDVGDEIRTLNVSDIARIEFSPDSAPMARSAPPDDGRPTLRRAENATLTPDPTADEGRPTLRRADSATLTPDPTADAGRPTLRRADSATQPAPDPTDSDRPVLRRAPGATQPTTADSTAPARTTELPSGTNIVVRMIDSVDSDVNKVGQTFAASVDEPVMINGSPAIPRGADVVIRLVDDAQAGRLAGRASVTLRLDSVKVDGRVVEVNTLTVSQESDSRGQQTAKVAGGTAALGAVLGTIAGGGKGAVGGAVAGGAVGTGAAAVLKGTHVKVPSETRLTFVLDTAVKI
jgi:hypothetical protein